MRLIKLLCMVGSIALSARADDVQRDMLTEWIAACAPYSCFQVTWQYDIPLTMADGTVVTTIPPHVATTHMRWPDALRHTVVSPPMPTGRGSEKSKPLESTTWIMPDGELVSTTQSPGGTSPNLERTKLQTSLRDMALRYMDDCPPILARWAGERLTDGSLTIESDANGVTLKAPEGVVHLNMIRVDAKATPREVIVRFPNGSIKVRMTYTYATGPAKVPVFPVSSEYTNSEPGTDTATDTIRQQRRMVSTAALSSLADDMFSPNMKAAMMVNRQTGEVSNSDGKVIAKFAVEHASSTWQIVVIASCITVGAGVFWFAWHRRKA